jgi:hypothetical protein
MRVVDTSGIEAEAIQLEGPTILGIEGGDACISEGEWAIYYPGVKPLPVTQEQFEARFKEL